jgi:N utilization substance protein B
VSAGRASAPRHQSRRAALQALYAADVSAAASRGAAQELAEVFEQVAAHFDLHGGAHAFARELLEGVASHRAEIDAEIGARARNWRIERMAAVDRNVLRLATFELLHTATPASVVIDEAVDLAREFGSDASPAFVNGVLDAVARGLGLAARDAERTP